MNRRSFLSSAGALAAGTTLATGKVLATPQGPATSDPAPGGNLASTVAARLSPEARLARFRRRVLDTDPTTLNTGWEDVLVPQGAVLGGLAGDPELLDWAVRWAEPHLRVVPSPETRILKSGERFDGVVLDTYCGNWGMPLVTVPLYRNTHDKRYRELAVQVCDHLIHNSIRLVEGGIAHGDFGAAMRERLWVDTLYYTASPLALTYAITGEKRFAEEAIRQCVVHAKYLQDPATGLFFHDVIPGTPFRSDTFWARGNGWVILGLLDTLLHVPATLPGRDAVLDSYRRLVSGLVRFQHPGGLWHIIPEDPQSHLEVSGTTMILTGILGGINARFVQPQMIPRVALALGELCSWIDRQGALQGAQRPAGLGDWDTHKMSSLGECTYATGLFLRLLATVATTRHLPS